MKSYIVIAKFQGKEENVIFITSDLQLAKFEARKYCEAQHGKVSLLDYVEVRSDNGITSITRWMADYRDHSKDLIGGHVGVLMDNYKPGNSPR